MSRIVRGPDDEVFMPVPIPIASWPFGAMFQTTGTAATQ
jgi:hypothetical protein